MPAPKIIGCDAWGARPPSSAITPAGKPDKAIVHHTAGHAPGTSLEDAKAYARSIQNDHMNRPPPDGPYKDSGHNFLVMRNGLILEGRHGSIAAIVRGVMIQSAHCPGQNDQPGVEHEHISGEAMTNPQKQASIDLHTWICLETGIVPSAIHGHGEFFATACPDNLTAWLPDLRRAVATNVGHGPADPPDRHLELLWREWRFGEGRFKGDGPANPKTRPKSLPNPAPREWLQRAITFLLRRGK